MVEHLPFKQVADGSIPSTLMESVESQQARSLLIFYFEAGNAKKSTCLRRESMKRLLELTYKDSYMFKESLQQFYYNCRVRNLSEKTLNIYGERLTNFYNFLKVKKVDFDKTEKSTVQDYIMSMKDKVSDHTVNGRIRVLKTFFGFLASEGLWNNGNPMQKISFVKTERRIKPVLAPEQIEQVLKYFNKNTYTGYRNYCMVCVFWDSLIRLSELMNLRVDDVNFKEGTLKVLGKGRKERIVPLGAKTIKHLHRFWISYRNKIDCDYFFCDSHGRPLEKRNVERILERTGEKCGIHITPHLLRHSGATFLALTGCPAFLLQKLLGHTTLSTTQIYVNLKDDERLKQTFLKYSPMDSLKV